MNKFFLILFVFAVVFLSTALWVLIIVSIVDFFYNIEWYNKALYSLSIVSIVLIFFSHAFLYQIMYDTKIYSLLINWIKSHDITLLIIFTLGVCNTYLLDLYYTKNEYSKFDLLQYRVNITNSIAVMFPLINIYIYLTIIKNNNIHKKISIHDMVSLYIRGKLIYHIIKYTK